MSSEAERKAEAYALLSELRNLNELVAAINLEIKNKSIELNEVDLTIKEMDELDEAKDSLIPLGPVYVKGSLSKEVIVPIGASYLVKMSPEEAKKKLGEVKERIEKELKELEKSREELLKKISSIESQLMKLQGSVSARETKEGPKESGEGGK